MINMPILKFNLKDKISQIRDELIDDVLKYKHQANSFNYNFKVVSEHSDYLYDIFIKKCKKHLNNFTLCDNNFTLWGYYSNSDYFEGNVWHNHISTSTINSVLYIETVKDKGIDFEYSGNHHYIEPKDFDFLIFPDFLNHLPRVSKDKRRISFNMELKCIEKSKDIFKL